MRRFRNLLWASVFLAAMAQAAERDPAHATSAARDWVAAHEAAIVQELRTLVALPNVANNHDDIRKNADLLVQMLERRGIAARILETPGAPVSVYGELNTRGAQ
jgi:hypothetical protein